MKNSILKPIFRALAASSLLGVVQAAQTQAFQRSAMEFVDAMGPGINIGNTFDVPNGDETEWGNPKVTRELIHAYKEKGFQAVRIPISWRKQFSREDPVHTIKPAFLERVKEVVDWCMEEDLVTIINIHHDGGDDGWPGAWLTIDGKHEEQAGEILKHLWTQIANTFRSYDERLIFEAFNEVRKAKRYAGVSGKQANQEDWGGQQAYFDVVNRYGRIFYDAVRATGGNNAKRYLMIPTYAAGFQPHTIRAWKTPNANDNHIIATIHCYEPGDFCLWGNRKAHDPAYAKQCLDRYFPVMKEHFIDKGIPLILGEVNATLRYYDAERLLPNHDARVRWVWQYVNEARKNRFAVVFWETGAGGMGEIDRRTCKWIHPSIIEAFIGAHKGTMTKEDAEKLAQSVKVSATAVYSKTDDVLRWKIGSDSYAKCWGQTMGFGNLNGNGVNSRYLSSDENGNLYVHAKGLGGNMLHQQFWADQSITAKRTFKAYVMKHEATPLAGRKLVFSLKALNGTTANVKGFLRIPGVKDQVHFGADIGQDGAFVATPENPVVTVEIPLPAKTDAVWRENLSGGISAELQFFPGKWNEGKKLDCVMSPIRLK